MHSKNYYRIVVEHHTQTLMVLGISFEKEKKALVLIIDFVIKKCEIR